MSGTDELLPGARECGEGCERVEEEEEVEGDEEEEEEEGEEDEDEDVDVISLDDLTILDCRGDVSLTSGDVSLTLINDVKKRLREQQNIDDSVSINERQLTTSPNAVRHGASSSSLDVNSHATPTIIAGTTSSCSTAALDDDTSSTVVTESTGQPQATPLPTSAQALPQQGASQRSGLGSSQGSTQAAPLQGTSQVSVPAQSPAPPVPPAKKRFRKKTCIIKLDGCHYTIVANTALDDSAMDTRTSTRPRRVSRTSSLTVLKRTSTSSPGCGTGPPVGGGVQGGVGGSRGMITVRSVSSPSGEHQGCGGVEGGECAGGVKEYGSIFLPPSPQREAEERARDLGRVDTLPPADTTDALKACSLRLRELLKKLEEEGNEELSKKELYVNLDYAARVAENIYIVETSKLLDGTADDDVLGVVEPDGVPREVRDWLTMTFTRTNSTSSCRRHGDDKLKFRSVAHAIRAGIVVDRIYRRTASVTNESPSEVQLLLKTIDDWSFDVFSLNEKGEGHALRDISQELLRRYDLINKFKISKQSLEGFLLKLECGYSKYGNPYHNLIHAADVAQTTSVILAQSGLAIWLTDVEMLAALTSAMIHDYEHTGTTNTFHINTSSDLALMYNDRAVLENYHVSASFKLIRDEEYNILSGLKPDEYREYRSLVIELVLATDMSSHFQQIKTMRNLLTMPDNHPAKDWNLHNRWTEQLLEEFFRQGDREVKLGLPVSPLCDRNNTLVAESQIGFIDFIVEPSFNVMSEAIDAMTSSLQQQLTLLASSGGGSGGGAGGRGGGAGVGGTVAAGGGGGHSSVSGGGGVGDKHAISPSFQEIERPTTTPTPPSTPKSPHLTGRNLKLKMSWRSCLLDNKTRWKEKAAEVKQNESVPEDEPESNSNNNSNNSSNKSNSHTTRSDHVT